MQLIIQFPGLRIISLLAQFLGGLGWETTVRILLTQCGLILFFSEFSECHTAGPSVDYHIYYQINGNKCGSSIQPLSTAI